MSEMQGKLCIVTGATAGIGFVTAQALAQKGAQVLIVGRNLTKCQQAVAQIKQQTGNNQVDYLLADLSSQQAIHKLADEFLSKHNRLDLLVNNAGAIFMTRQETVDGIEMTFGLNHLNYFLLTHRLIEALKAAPQARVVNVSSIAHEGGKINFDDINGQHRSYNGGWSAYQQSKLANILFTYELAQRLNSTRITANALHPGVVASQFGSNNGWFWNWFIKPFMGLISINETEGARTSIYLASAPEVEQVTGKYFVKERAINSAPQSYDVNTAKRLWNLSLEMTKLRSSI